MPIKTQVKIKKLERMGGALRLKRLVIQSRESVWKWREYTPFNLTGEKSIDEALLKKAEELSRKRIEEYASLERFAERLIRSQSKKTESLVLQS